MAKKFWLDSKKSLNTNKHELDSFQQFMNNPQSTKKHFTQFHDNLCSILLH